MTQLILYTSLAWQATTEESSVVQYDQHRKTQEAQAADAQDEAELKALENKIKHRTG